MKKETKKKSDKSSGSAGINIPDKYIHLIAIVLFVVAPMMYLLPAIQGKILYQHDKIQGAYHSKEIQDFRAKTGEEPLWNSTMFSGMPAFQGDIKHNTSIGTKLAFFLRDLFPEPIGIFVAMCFNFYLLMIVLGVNPWLSIAGSLVFAFSTFNVVSIESGHSAKINALAFAPGVLAGLYMAMRQRIFLGLSLFGLALAAHLAANHFQITYYLFMVSGLYFVFEAIEQIKSGKTVRLLLVTLGFVVASAVALGTNASRFWTTYEYSKESTRGGKSELTIDKGEQGSGLDKEYAMRWSHGIMESFSWVIPNFMGGASQESLDENSALAQKGVPRNALKSIPTYWGDQPFTAGPLYQGAIVIFLFILGALLIKGHIKWWLVSISILIALLSYGKNLKFFSDFFFHYVPMYNKFRAPSMVILFFQITLPLLGLLGLTHLFKQENKNNSEVQKKFKLATLITTGIVAVFGLLGSFVYGYEGVIDEQLIKNNWPVDALREDRASMLRMDAIRSLTLILMAAGLIFAYLKSKLPKTPAIVGVALLMCADVALVSKRYIHEDKFVTKREYERNFEPTQADLRIMSDTSGVFRVADFSTNIFNDARPSYFHHSIGGYHGAKMQRYQEMIEQHISINNMRVYNMLNTRYFITNNPTTKGLSVQTNPQALGNSWFVKEIVKVFSADEEVDTMKSFDPETQVVVDASKFGEYIDDFQSSDSTGSINLTSFSPRKLEYKAVVNGDKPQFAVFSEIYYNAGHDDWKVFIDGEPSNHIRVNYILRGMLVPPGEHLIEFKFEPRSYFMGLKISGGFSVLLIALLVMSLGLEYRKRMKHNITEV